MARATKGDHDAFRILVERYQGRAYALALRVLKDEERARDAVQEGFLKAYTNLAKFEGRSSFYTWLYRLVMNTCLDMKRRDKSDREVEWDETRPGDPASAPEAEALAGQGAGHAGPARELDRSELRKQIAEAIAQLPGEARETLLLREVDGLTYAEIAEALSIPKGTVMSRLHYARKRMQQILTEMGVGIGAGMNEAVENGGRA
ncbi:MAG: sigma-70 family RNA polymerase sigma factor [Deltaproteobacteria bacterium]|nr:sigma-70 family RNA polymerase sigma factor [Deltaproteobacteria bacterium]MBW2448416.1 sigma-70 family RNA polymerase sigma factor [Deltaproteobacteria bacterium]